MTLTDCILWADWIFVRFAGSGFLLGVLVTHLAYLAIYGPEIDAIKSWHADTKGTNR